MNKVSVVVPCYNCATTIEKCCISILNQEKIDIELICIDDGSTDNTWEVLCGLKALYPKLIIHKIFNSGVSNARNVGISLSTNEFVGFVDADDTIHKEMYFKMSTELIMENIDLVICNFSTSDTLPKLVGETEYINQNDVLNASLYNSDIQGFVWNRLYKKHIIIENDIKFNPNMKAVEDLDFNLNYLQYANSCTYIQEQLYNYNINDDSTMFSGLNKSKINFMSHYHELMKYNLVDKSYTEKIQAHYGIYLLMLLSNFANSRKDNPLRQSTLKKEIINDLRGIKKEFNKYSKNYSQKYKLGYFLAIIQPNIFIEFAKMQLWLKSFWKKRLKK